MAVLGSSMVVLVGIIAMWLYTRNSGVHISPKPNTTYDYIIVGAGSAGSVLASRLTENPDINVLLVEAGGNPDGLWVVNTPGAIPNLLHSDLDWDYRTVQQTHSSKGIDGQSSYWGKGRSLGVSSFINFMTYVRGNRYDYDGWAAKGCDGWSYREVLPYFLKS
ncbi:hypothetical protein ScPMuIL_012554 [Solemya velum]